jgi:hypothetical protein
MILADPEGNLINVFSRGDGMTAPANGSDPAEPDTT